jgi:hypothetical protein
MRKILVFAAAIAAFATMVSCSNDDELSVVEPQPVEPEQPVVKGTPFKVRIGDGTTRADFSKTTTDALSTFQLFGIQQTSTPNYWMSGLKFNKSGNDWSAAINSDVQEFTGDWTATTPSWPVDNKETGTNFYGFSDGVTDGVPAGLTPNITPTAQSFTFTFGAGSESSQWFAKWSETEGPIQFGSEATWNTMKNSQGLRNEATLKSTATVLNSDNLTDLLVTYDDLNGVEGTEGTLDVNFKHALSNLVIRAMFVGDNGGSQWPDGSIYYIQWIRVHGLYHTGTYTFGTGWSIEPTNDSREHAYEHVWGESDSANPDPRWTMDLVPYETYNALDADGKKATYVDIVPAGEFMVIPQQVTTYDGYGTPISDAEDANLCYIEMYGYFWTPGAANKKSTAYSTNGEVHYYPLKLNNAVGNTSTFMAGKKHVVVIDLTAVLKSNGQYAANPSQAGGN